MLEALNELFGRSTVDPQVEQAYELGEIENVLVECGFTSEFARRLGRLDADGFADFLILVHREVEDQLQSAESQQGRWPTDGLANGSKPDPETPKVPGVHQAA